MKQHRLWHLAAALFICMSTVVGCASYCGCQTPGAYGVGGPVVAPYPAPGSGTFAPPGGPPSQPPVGSGLF